MQEVSIDSLQQQVRTFRVKSQEVCFFLWDGGVPPHASDLGRVPLWCLSVPVPLLISLLILCLTHLLSALSSLMALPLSVSSSAGGGGGVFPFFPLLPPSPFSLCTHRRSLPSFLYHPVPWLHRFVEPVVGLPGFCHYVGRPLAGS